MGSENTRGLVLVSDRLRLTAMTRDALQSWVEGDVPRLEAETGAVFAQPLATPPLFGDDLPMFRDRMVETPDEVGWWVWLISRRSDGQAVGVCGLGGPPGAEGAALLGYAVYPAFAGQGFATEAARALISWVLAQPGVTRVRATVPVWNAPSLAVARKLGMEEKGHEIHPEVGEVAVFERNGGA